MDYYPVYKSIVPEKQRLYWVELQTEMFYRRTGYEEYRVNGVLHREYDLPAVEWPDGGKCWYKNGKLHRNGYKPAVELDNGTKHYYKNGVYQH
jgi:hypothetical protein